MGFYGNLLRACGFRVEVETAVGGDNRILHRRLPGPDKDQHLTYAHPGTGHAKLDPGDKEVDGLEHVHSGLRPEQLADNRHCRLDLTGKRHRVLWGRRV